MSEPSLDASLGSLELGVLFSTLLYGVMIVQCYTYYQAGFKDAWLVKALVRKKIPWKSHASDKALPDHLRNVRACPGCLHPTHNGYPLVDLSRPFTQSISGYSSIP